ncbi:hypothetical protein V3C33_20140 [Micrococcaceae bacterium Sec5.7]
MSILSTPDSFKGTFSADHVAGAIAAVGSVTYCAGPFSQSAPDRRGLS